MIFRKIFSKYTLLKDDVQNATTKEKNDINIIQKKYILIYYYKKKFKSPILACGKIKINDILEYDGHYELYENVDDDKVMYVFINGMGTMVYPNKNKYTGYWKNSKPFGFGQYIDNNNNIFFGNWDGYNMCDRCKIIYNNGGKYDGQVVVKNENIYNLIIQKHGFGKYDLPNDDYYEGEFKYDLYDGKGKYVCINRIIYISNYTNGKKQGKGKIIYDIENSEKIVYWKDDKIYDKSDFIDFF